MPSFPVIPQPVAGWFVVPSEKGKKLFGYYFPFFFFFQFYTAYCFMLTCLPMQYAEPLYHSFNMTRCEPSGF